MVENKYSIKLKDKQEDICYPVADVISAYEEGSFYCIHHASGFIIKYSIANIVYIIEPYFE